MLRTFNSGSDVGILELGIQDCMILGESGIPDGESTCGDLFNQLAQPLSESSSG